MLATQNQSLFTRLKQWFYRNVIKTSDQTTVLGTKAAQRKTYALMLKAEKAAMNKASGEGVAFSANYKKADTNSKLLSLVKKVLNNGKAEQQDKLSLGTVAPEIASKIYDVTGINCQGFEIIIESKQILHILRDHGPKGKADQSLKQPEYIAKLEYALSAPDEVKWFDRTQAYKTFTNGKSRPATSVLFEKRIGDNSYYIIEAVPETKAKKVYVVSAFIGKPGYETKKRSAAVHQCKKP